MRCCRLNGPRFEVAAAKFCLLKVSQKTNKIVSFCDTFDEDAQKCHYSAEMLIVITLDHTKYDNKNRRLLLSNL